LARRELDAIDAARWPVVVGLALALLASAALGTLSGADLARQRIVPREIAEATLGVALERGSSDPDVRQNMIDLRRRISRRPLDSKTRIAYASLWLGLSRRLDDLTVAAFHARRASELAPVTLPVVRPAVLVLANTDQLDAALALTREIFEFDAQEAAKLLASVEHLTDETSFRQGMPESPEAALAWFDQLNTLGRRVEAREWLETTYSRWPDHPIALRHTAATAVRKRDLARLAELFPEDRSLPDEPDFAIPMIFRAHLKAAQGDSESARADIAHALTLDTRSSWPSVHAAQAYVALGDYDEARGQFNRALFGFPRTESMVATRRHILSAFARMEEEHGQPAASLRLWNSLLELDPENVEARRHIDDLTGFQR